MIQTTEIPDPSVSAALPAGFIPATLTEIEVVSVGTKRFVITPNGDAALPEVSPGAHVDIALPSGRIRQYSVLTPDRDGAIVIVVKREPRGRGGSAEMHELSEGDAIGLGEARNHLPIEDHDGPAVLIAGGIGITPILSMARHLRAAGRPWTLFYASQRPEDMAFRAELADLPEVTLHFDQQTGKVLNIPAIVDALPEGAHLYACGPVPMLDAYRKATAALPAERVHWELFESTQDAADEGGFEVVCARSDMTLTIPPGRRIIDVLMENGIHVPMSCEQGICGSCETPVLDGTPDHRDEVLSDEEKEANDTMMVCCGGCIGDRLVLDI